jgi:Kef-type K+ transport system membrane component KefB/nucleotide-binding universal stress UspA family protein
MDHAHTLLFLLVDLVIIILAARALGILARRVRQPSVIGEVMAGILLGPTVLGRIFPALPGFLFPPDVPLKQISDLGLILFMFLVGLEMDTRLMRTEARKSMVISASGIAVPFILGMVLAYFLAPVNNEGEFLQGSRHPPTTFAFALFMGASMCITAFPVLARFLVETGMYKTPLGTSALCAAAMDDAIAWILLAAVIGITNTGSPAQALPALSMTLVFVGFMFTAGRRLLKVLARRYDASGSLTVDQVALILCGVLAAAFVTEIIGIHAIFGAFIFGVVMPKRSGITHALTEKIEDFTVILLLPVFFGVVGLRTNLLSLNNLDLLGWTLLIFLAATVGKFLGTGMAAYLTGSSRRDAIVVGALMNTRGLTELVILSIGLHLGVLSDRTFAMMVIMALVTTVMAGPIVDYLIPRTEIIENLVHGAEAERGEAPAVRVLVALGNLLNAPGLIQTALALMGERRPGELLLVKLIPSPRAPEFHSGIADLEAQARATAEELLPSVAQARLAGVAARVICFPTENVGLDLARIADTEHCDALLLGWHRALLHNDVVRALVHHTFVAAPCDVVVLVDRSDRGVSAVNDRPILAVLNGGFHDSAAYYLAAHVAKKLSTRIRLAGFFRGRKSPKSLKELADELSRERGLLVETVPLVEPVASILQQETGQAAAGVIVVSDDWLTEQGFGGPTQDIVDAAECPMLVVRGENWIGKRRIGASQIYPQ